MKILIAFIIAVLSGMGIGGGGLFALYLKYASEHGQLHVQAINLIFFLFASGASLTVHLRRRKIYPIPMLLMMIFGLVGSVVGSAVATGVNGSFLGKIFGGMMICAGLYSFFK